MIDHDCDERVDEVCDYDCTDADGDGVCLPLDCDDSASDVHPRGSELCDDGIDNDCNGVIDEWCGEECSDADGDGYCLQNDCNEDDPGRHPGAAEVYDHCAVSTSRPGVSSLLLLVVSLVLSLHRRRG